MPQEYALPLGPIDFRAARHLGIGKRALVQRFTVVHSPSPGRVATPTPGLALASVGGRGPRTCPVFLIRAASPGIGEWTAGSRSRATDGPVRGSKRSGSTVSCQHVLGSTWGRFVAVVWAWERAPPKGNTRRRVGIPRAAARPGPWRLSRPRDKGPRRRRAPLRCFRHFHRGAFGRFERDATMGQGGRRIAAGGIRVGCSPRCSPVRGKVAEDRSSRAIASRRPASALLVRSVGTFEVPVLLVEVMPGPLQALRMIHERLGGLGCRRAHAVKDSAAGRCRSMIASNSDQPGWFRTKASMSWCGFWMAQVTNIFDLSGC